MPRLLRTDTTRTFAHLIGVYADQAEPPDDDFVIPEDLATLDDEALAALHTSAAEHFDALYGDGQGLSDEDMAALAVLTEGIETLLAEMDTRSQAAEVRATQAAELAARVHHHEERSETIDDTETVPEEGDEAEEEDGEGEGGEGEAPPEAVAASGARREIRVSTAALRGRARHMPAQEARTNPQTMRDVVLANGEGSGFAPGFGLDWTDVGRIVDRRLGGYNHSQYARAHEEGRQMRQQFSVATIRKPFPDDMIIQSSDPQHVDEVLRRAMDEHRLPGGALTASGGWCAPSEVIYDLCELESNDGLVSVPEIGVSRGGISWTTGPKFSDIYANTGFCYTEQDDIDGDYDGSGGGSKPCYRVDCPDFQEVRLDACGLCIQAGLLQSRGYPEVIARTTRGGLVAHNHKMSARTIQGILAGSTAVAMAAGQAGAAAPVLSAIELTSEHIRYTERMARSATMEAIFPFWVHGAIRSDLSRRQGTDLDPLSVTDAQINAWFAQRGIAPQFVYDWQDLAVTTAATFNKWPAAVEFLMYPAGTWVRGTSDIITIDTMYDSTLLGTNDFTALFTEEGSLLAKLCTDSRHVTVNICADGSTGSGVDIACDGSSVTP